MKMLCMIMLLQGLFAPPCFVSSSLNPLILALRKAGAEQRNLCSIQWQRQPGERRQNRLEFKNRKSFNRNSEFYIFVSATLRV